MTAQINNTNIDPVLAAIANRLVPPPAPKKAAALTWSDWAKTNLAVATVAGAFYSGMLTYPFGSTSILGLPVPQSLLTTTLLGGACYKAVDLSAKKVKETMLKSKTSMVVSGAAASAFIASGMLPTAVQMSYNSGLLKPIVVGAAVKYAVDSGHLNTVLKKNVELGIKFSKKAIQYSGSAIGHAKQQAGPALKNALKSAACFPEKHPNLTVAATGVAGATAALGLGILAVPGAIMWGAGIAAGALYDFATNK